MADTAPGIATFLFTDIEGSTRLWAADAAAMDAALAQHDRLVTKIVRARGGQIFSRAGDSFAVAFVDTADAVNAAVELQRELAAATWPGDLAIRVKIAIHAGPAFRRDDDYFGPTLNRSARILAIARAGQVLVSSATRGLLVDSPHGVEFEDLGHHRLRDLAEPERIYLLRHPDIPVGDTEVRSLSSLPNNLPANLSPFIGRVRELEGLRDVMAGNRLVTLTGVGGAGKSRLALQAAADALDEFPDGVWLVELAPVADPALVTRAIASALQVEETPSRPLLDLVVDHLQHRHLLVVLDNCEHLIEEAARLAEHLLTSAPHLTILGTSREALGVAGEAIIQIRSLEVPATDEIDAVIASDATRLFATRGQSISAGFAINENNAAAVAHVCRRLDGLPLAIELAAARLRMLSASQIAERLDDRFRLLTGGSRTALPRQQTLEATISWSYDLLDDRERLLFDRLAVFVSDFSLEAAEAVCGTAPVVQDDVFDILFHLVDKSLVSTLPGDEVRYRLLESLRQYGLEKLAARGETDEVRARHAAYYRALVEAALPNIRGPEEEVWRSRLDAEIDNLRAALRWSIDGADADLAQGMAGDLYRYWMLRHHHVEGLEWLKEALAREPSSTEPRGRALTGAGTLSSQLGDRPAARTYLEEAIALLEGLDSPFYAAAVSNLARLLIDLGAYEDARALIPAIDNLDEPMAQSWAALCLAEIEQAAGNHETVLPLLERAISLARATRSDEIIAGHVGEAALATMDVDVGLAWRYCEELRELPTMTNAPGRRNVIPGIVARRMGRLDDARHEIARGMAMFRTIRDHDRIAGLLRLVFDEWGALFADLGQYEKAAMALAAGERLRGDTVRLPQQQSHFEQYSDVVRNNLTPEVFAEEWQRGWALPFDDLVAHLTDEATGDETPHVQPSSAPA